MYVLLNKCELVGYAFGGLMILAMFILGCSFIIIEVLRNKST